jgi:hypothetical protein
MDRIVKGSSPYHMRSSDRDAGMRANGLNTMVGSKNTVGSHFLTCIVKETIGRGHRQVLGPVDIIVSAVDTTCCEAGGVDELTYQKELHCFCQ